MSYAKFMARPLGRGIRIALGLFLLVWGVLNGSLEAMAIAVIGAGLMACGLLNVSPTAFLIGAPLKGNDALKAA